MNKYIRVAEYYTKKYVDKDLCDRCLSNDEFWYYCKDTHYHAGFLLNKAFVSLRLAVIGSFIYDWKRFKSWVSTLVK